MRMLVVGAQTRLGVELVRRALGHGHQVRALAPTGALPFAARGLEVVPGEASDYEAVRDAVRGVPAVAVALPEDRGSSGAFETSIGNVVQAMAETMAARLVVESASGTFAREGSQLPLKRRLFATTVKGRFFDGLEAMERRVMASDLDWTIVRPSGFTDSAPTGHYRVSLSGEILPSMKPVSRADVASVMLKALETDTYRRRTVTVAG